MAGGATTGPGVPTINNVEQWNGSSWTEVGDLNKAKADGGGTGTTPAGLIFGGFTFPGAPPTYAILAETETWNGSAWSEVGDLNNTRYTNSASKAGTSTAALTWGRANESPDAIVEQWDGSSWTEVGDLNDGRYSVGGAGSQTSALATGGASAPVVGNTELFDGSSWTEVNNLNTARYGADAAGDTNTSVLAFGGTPPHKDETEEWDGTNWTEVADLSTARVELAGAGNKNTALAIGGAAWPTVYNNVEEWSQSASVETIAFD
jgi:hypothetical protein